MFAALVENSTDFIGLCTLDGAGVYVNEAGRRLLEMGALDVRATKLTDYFVPEDLPYVEQVILPGLKRDGRWTGDFRFRNFRTGEAVPVRYNLFCVRDPRTGEPAAIATVSPDIGERTRSERRLRTLVDAGAALSHSLDYAQTLANLADLVVRTSATFCVIDVFEAEPGGARTIRQLAAVHAERAKRPLMTRLQAFVPAAEHLAHPVAQALQDGSSSLVAAVDDAWIDRIAVLPGHAGVLRELGLRSLLTVPLVAGGEVVGALTCGLGDEAGPPAGRPRSYDAEDLFFVEELGRRAGAAIENARRYERERRIAMSLQAASLPRTLPRVDHLHLDAEYRPGKEEATIGGDWYDAFMIDDGRIVLTIGDVLGNGLDAAITMTKLRQAMQSAAMVVPDPNVMLDVADKTLRMHDPDGYATALAAIFDPRTQITTFASAGHPGPVRRAADGRIEEFSSPGLLLGLRTGADHAIRDVMTLPGSTLVFFTDGLTEATRDIDEGHRRLHAALALPEVVQDPHPARAIVEAVLAGEPASDDVAVLVAKVAQPTEPGQASAQTTYPETLPPPDSAFARTGG